MTDPHEMSGAYAINALDPADRAAFEEHLATCPECRAEVDDLRQAATSLAALSDVSPPAAIRERVLDHVAQHPQKLSPAEHGRVLRITRVWLPTAAAAAVAVGVLVIAPWNQSDQPPPRPTAIERILDAPDAEADSVRLGGGTSIRLVRSVQQRGAVLTANNLTPPSGKVYQLWFARPDGGFVSAGLVPRVEDPEVFLDGDAITATGAGITLEPGGGSKQPTTQPIALFSFDDLEPT